MFMSISLAKYLSELQGLDSPIDVEIVTFGKTETEIMDSLSKAADLLKDLNEEV